MRSVAIVGANLAGGRAAEALRSEGFDGRIHLIGAEAYPPYERPPLSKAMLTGESDFESTYLRTLSSWEELAVEVVLSHRVTSIDPTGTSIELDDGRRLDADAVLLCTGGRPRQLNVPGVDLEGVTYLRDIDESLAIADRLRGGANVVIIGAGFIGAEVAAAARKMDCDVTMLEVAAVPLLRVLGEELGALYAEEHRRRGVDVRTGVGVARIDGDNCVKRVVLTDGSHLDADVVVVGVGVEPATELAEELGLQVANGIVVDDRCRTSLPGVFAAGDVTNHPNPLFDRNIRLESWQNAQDQGVAAARSILGGTDAYSAVPWFWSDQYDLNLQIAGCPDPDDLIVYRGEPDRMDFCAFHLREGVLVGVIAVNRRREVRAAMKLIEQRAIVGPELLADEGADLRTTVVERA